MGRPKASSKGVEHPQTPVSQTSDLPLSLRGERRSTTKKCPAYTPNAKSRGIQQTPFPTKESTPGPRKSQIPALPLNKLPSPGSLESRRTTRRNKCQVETEGLATGFDSLEIADDKRTRKGRKKKAQESDSTSTKAATIKARLNSLETVDESPAPVASTIQKAAKKGFKIFTRPVGTLVFDEEEDEESSQEPIKESRSKAKLVAKPAVSKKNKIETSAEVSGATEDEQEIFTASGEDEDELHAQQREVILNFLKENTNWSTEKALWDIEQVDVETLEKAIALHSARGDPVELLVGMLEVATRFQAFRDCFDVYLGMAADHGLFLREAEGGLDTEEED